MALKSGDVNCLLDFLSTACGSNDDEKLTSECLQHYSTDAITQAKNKLWDVTPENVKNAAKSEDRVTKTRRGIKKERSNLSDILILFRKFNKFDIELPKFQVDRYQALPPMTGYGMLAKQIENLAEQVKELKIQCAILQGITKGTNSPHLKKETGSSSKEKKDKSKNQKGKFT